MADKKITALTSLNAGDPDPAVDLLHIIDYSASPVNKKITVADLFNKVDTNTTIYGDSRIFEVGSAADTNAYLTVTTGSSASTDGTVVVNADSVNFVDFTVNSTSGSAISVDAATDIVTINGASAATTDVQVNGDNGVNIFSDAGNDCVGVGTSSVDGTATLTVAADGTTGHAISTAGNINMSGYHALTAAAGNNAASLTAPVTGVALPASGTCVVTLADGADGQIKVITTVSQAGSSTCTLDATNLVTTVAPSISDVGDTVTLWFDTTANKWLILSTVTTGNIGA